jgi:hypothetical protein
LRGALLGTAFIVDGAFAVRHGAANGTTTGR